MFVKLWMNTSPITITANQTIAEAQSCMQENRIRRLPVVDQEGRLVGILSRQDIADALPSTIEGGKTEASSLLASTTTVEAIMAGSPLVAEPMTPLETVAQRMRKHKVGAMPVVQDGKLVGIITESDIFSAFMTVLGAGGEGARIEMIIGKTSRSLYDAMEICKRYHMLIQAITVHHNYGENQQLLTIRVMGDELADMLAALRKSGAKINRIIEEDEG
jgi:acetoin utilization protein AcuB